MGRKLTNEEASDRIREINDNFELVGDYNGTDFRTPTILRCKKHDLVFPQNMSSFFSGKNGCPMCRSEAISLKLAGNTREGTKSRVNDTASFIKKASAIHDSKYDYSKTEWVNNCTEVIITCPKHGDFVIKPKAHIRGNGCRYCACESRAECNSDSFEDFLGKAISQHGDIYDYSEAKEVYIDSKAQIPIICKKHGVFWQIPRKHVFGQGCPVCCSSHGAEKIFLYLKNVGVKFIREFSFEDCRDSYPLPFDFYLPDYNLCIEYQGRQHFEDIEAWQKHGGLKYVQAHDKTKREYCISHGLQLITIPYQDEEYIEDILSTFLF